MKAKATVCFWIIAPWLPVATAAVESLPPSDIKDRSCIEVACHDQMQAKEVVHGPVAVGKCNPCHEQPDSDKHNFKPMMPTDALCQACHITQLKNYVHEPVYKGQCTLCHDPHQSDYRYMLRLEPAQELCLSCHRDEPFMNKKHIHYPVAEGSCILCHESHSSWRPHLLIKEGRELCLSCHQDIDDRLADTRHVHPPARDDCTVCHDPHGSDLARQIRQGETNVCLTCHTDIAQRIQTSEHVHDAVFVEEGCGNCHNGHSSTLPRLLKRSLLDSCLQCHNKEIEMPDGSRLTNMARLLRDNPDQHGPVRRADCSACHNPHASPNFRLLVKEYPQSFYAPFALANYELCFQCHIPDLVLKENGIGLTLFRDGDRNLHFVHVNKKDKGRTCRACHAVHASRHPAHIRDTVPFGTGGWEYPINFEKTEHGGRCAPGCHKERSYAYETNDKPAPLLSSVKQNSQ